MAMSELPAGWVECSFSDLNQHEPQSIDPSKFPSETFELYSVPSFPLRKPETVVGKEIGSAKLGVAPNDVLVCKINPRINRVWQVATRGVHRQIASSEWIVLRSPLCNPTYLRHFFSSPDFRELICNDVIGVGGSLTRAQPKVVAGFPVLLAPAAEQKRIADKLDALLAKVDACRQRLDRVPALLKRFRQAVLAAATAGDLTADWRNKCEVEKTGADLLKLAREMHKLAAKRVEDIPMPVEDESIVDIPNSWTVASGAEVVEPKAEIVYGIVQPGPKLEEGVPYVRGMDIENGRILVDQLMKTSQAIAEKYSRSALLGGDVLLGIIRATKVAIVPSVLNGANITQGTARFRPSSVIKTRYLAIALEAPSTQYWLHEHYRGIDMPGLNLADVRRVPIPLPPLEEQREIVRRVEALFAFADRLEARYLAARKQVDKLTPSLLAKAFRGELVPQDPNDEPASALLERIRAERAGQGALFDGAPKRRRKTS
jgi:type I restriction enzyme S subunit